MKELTGSFIVNPRFWYKPCVTNDAYKDSSPRGSISTFKYM